MSTFERSPENINRCRHCGSHEREHTWCCASCGEPLPWTVACVGVGGIGRRVEMCTRTECRGSGAVLMCPRLMQECT